MFRRLLTPAFLLTTAGLGACDNTRPGTTEPEAEAVAAGGRAEFVTVTNPAGPNRPHPYVGRIINIVSDAQATPTLCLDIANGGVVSQTEVHQFPCHGGLNQRWGVVQAPVHSGRLYLGWVQLRSVQNPALCLDVIGGTATGGESLQLYTCHGGASQTFALPRPSGPLGLAPAVTGAIATEVSGARMVLEALLPLAAGAVQQVAGSNASTQRWRFFDAVSRRWI